MLSIVYMTSWEIIINKNLQKLNFFSTLKTDTELGEGGGKQN